MSKQNKSKNKAHLFENAGPVSTINNSNINKTASMASIATGGLTLADSIYTPFRDINNADVQLVKPTNVSQINDFDTLQTFRRQLEPQQISYSDVGGHSKSQSWANIGKGAGAGATIGAGIGSFVGPIGTVIGGGIGGILGGGISAISEAVGGKRAKQKQKEEQASADENYNTQLNMLDNQAYNINTNQLAEKQFGYINALGGNLHSNSTTWNNGLNYIGSGGSHESNPNDGVAISTAPDGLQNKVEEGEVVWNDDYVFSRRLKVPKKDLEKNKWKGETYADIAKKLMDESAERPNDPIALRGLDDSLSRLKDSQEELKTKQEGNKIKKEIASMPPELLAQMQQAQQQPTEEEMMQQQAMEQMPQEQVAMIDPSMQQPMMQQPPLYATGGLLKGGPGSWHNLGGEYDFALNKKPISAIVNNVFQKNRVKKQPLIYKKKHFLQPDNNTESNFSDLDYTFEEQSPNVRESNFYIPTLNNIEEKEKMKDKQIYAKGGHLFDGLSEWTALVNQANRKTAFDIKYGELQPITRDPWYDSSFVKENQLTPNLIRRENENTTRSSRNFFENWNPEYLRYAPIPGGVGALALSLRKPNYSNANKIANISSGLRREISPKYTNIRMGYKPIDNTYSLNQLNAQQNAANDSIVRLSNGNRSMALASLLANDYNYNNQRGAMYRQDADYNRNDEFKTNTFNNENDKFDAQQYLAAESQNAQNRNISAAYLAEALKMKEQMDSDRLNAISANLTNLFNNIGAVGNDTFNANVASRVGDYGWAGASSKINYKKAKGGYLTIKTNNRRKE